MHKQIGYKLVRVADDGIYTTLYSKSIQTYTLGQTYRTRCRPHHKSGWYVCPSPALGAIVSRMPLTPGTYALLRCEVWGRHITYGSWKHAYACLRPLEEVERVQFRSLEIGSTQRGIPEDWQVTAVATRSCKARRSGISITEYELRAYDPARSPYWRDRKDGYNPITLATTTSGHGVPQWMMAVR